MNPDNYGLSLDQLLAVGAGAYNATLEERTARSANNAATASAQAQAAQSGSFAKIAMIGGGLLLVVILGIFFFRRGK